MALDTRFPAGMTIPVQFVYNDERSSMGIHPATLQRCVTRECLVFPALSAPTCEMPETPVLAVARTALFRPTSLHILLLERPVLSFVEGVGVRVSKINLVNLL